MVNDAAVCVCAAVAPAPNPGGVFTLPVGAALAAAVDGAFRAIGCKQKLSKGTLKGPHSLSTLHVSFTGKVKIKEVLKIACFSHYKITLQTECVCLVLQVDSSSLCPSI